MFLLLSLSIFIISFRFSGLLMYRVITVKLWRSSKSSPRSFVSKQRTIWGFMYHLKQSRKPVCLEQHTFLGRFCCRRERKQSWIKWTCCDSWCPKTPGWHPVPANYPNWQQSCGGIIIIIINNKKGSLLGPDQDALIT